ncbi:unnamed protein product [Ilex paraguariensis]|uniref:Isopenicillin N synthase-like Fe(2+) 2OG dioxygenase domain-containing protein n=1 Tax=Ilex paraguariensis TaxID=185542 RepID=A0ABC8V0T4_9AQUA
MSNGRYKSIEHRVTANGSKNRVSVPIFVNPRPFDVIRPLTEVLENGEKPMYKQVLYSDYVKHFFKKAHDGKDTRICKDTKSFKSSLLSSFGVIRRIIITINYGSSRHGPREPKLVCDLTLYQRESFSI